MTVITSTGLGSATTGGLKIERTPGITPEPRQKLRLTKVIKPKGKK